MKFVRNLENLFEKYIEGYCNAKFSGELQPAEIAKHVIREMENKRSIGISKTYVPNHYCIALGTHDYENLLPVVAAIQDELAKHLFAALERRGYTILGQPSFEFVADSTAKKNSFSVEGEFTEAIPYEKTVQQPQATEEPTDFGQTKKFTRTPVVGQEAPKFQGFITVVEGPDKGLKIPVGTQRFHMGRRESNELSLTDMNTSRLHAYISYEAGQHVLSDAQSLNGTYVNGSRISRKILQSGDQIKIGHTLLSYEVI